MWNKDTDLVLRDLVLRQTEVDWGKIASTIEWDTGTVSAKECQARWECVKETPVKGPWSNEEDEHLKRLVEIYGAKKWNLLARAFPGRSGKQCRERWHNHVDERVKKGEWTAEEDQILCEAQRQLGNKWSEMSRILHGRSENAIKNRFNSLNAKGLTETRANELLSKVGPAALAAAGHHTPTGNALGGRELEHEHHEQGPPMSFPQNVPHRFEGSPFVKTGGGHGMAGVGYSLGGGIWSSGSGGTEVGSTGVGGGGCITENGSTAMHALMAAVTEEREAHEVGMGGARAVFTGTRAERYSRCEETVPRDPDGSDVGSRDWGEDGVDGDTESLCGGGGGDGGRGEKVMVPTRRRGTKRERDEGQNRMGGPWQVACSRGDLAGEPLEPVPVPTEVSRRSKGSPRGMSILARAAGLVEVEDEEGSFTGSALGSKDEASDDTSSAGFGAPSNTADGTHHSLNDRGMASRNRFLRHSGGAHSSRVGSCGRISIQNPSKMNATDSRMGAASILRSMIDHGSTPPGSASPPPSACASGGADVAAGGGGGGGSGGGGGGAGGGGANGVFAQTMAGSLRGVDPAQARSNDVRGDGDRGVESKHWCDRTASSPSGFPVGADETFDPCQGAGARDINGWRIGFRSHVPGPSSVSPRSGWYVGPEGTYRRGLGSVPGPWRPYWRGEDEVDGDVKGTAEDTGINLQPAAETRTSQKEQGMTPRETHKRMDRMPGP